jgi:hypothetical protein
VDRARDHAQRCFRINVAAQRAVVDTRDDDLVPEVEGAGALREEVGELLVTCEMRPVVVQDPDLGRVRGAQAGDAPDHRFQLLDASAAVVDHRLLFGEQLLVERSEDEIENLGLRPEV